MLPYRYVIQQEKNFPLSAFWSHLFLFKQPPNFQMWNESFFTPRENFQINLFLYDNG